MEREDDALRALLNSPEATEWVLDQVYEALEDLSEDELRKLAEHVAASKVTQPVKDLVGRYTRWRVEEEARWLTERLPRRIRRIRSFADQDATRQESVRRLRTPHAPEWLAVDDNRFALRLLEGGFYQVEGLRGRDLLDDEWRWRTISTSLADGPVTIQEQLQQAAASVDASATVRHYLTLKFGGGEMIDLSLDASDCVYLRVASRGHSG